MTEHDHRYNGPATIQLTEPEVEAIVTMLQFSSGHPDRDAIVRRLTAWLSYRAATRHLHGPHA